MKKPLHMIYAFKLGDRDEVKTLRGLTSHKRVSPRNLELARRIIRESGGLDAAKEKSRDHAEKAKALIARTTLSGETSAFFALLIDYIEESLEWYK